MIYCFYLFDRNGVCLYYEDWHRVKRPKNLPEEQKLIFGLLFSLKATVCAMRPGGDGKLVPDALQSYNTSTYKLHYYETPTGLRFILITDPPVPSLRECLRQIYSHIYVEYVTKNPLQALGAPISSTIFSQSLNKYIRGLPYFMSS
mmetsp:Transcript_50046/g.156630  ORF Transcript_50046/g.156630 Transcript_50046/m.156630 type:complete len:146 (-) Transcript_50046:599-1036(-)